MVTPIIPTLRKQTHEINEFEDNLGYIVTSYFKKKGKRKKDPTTLLLQKYLYFLLLKLFFLTVGSTGRYIGLSPPAKVPEDKTKKLLLWERLHVSGIFNERLGNRSYIV